jgi:hypothetical protein
MNLTNYTDHPNNNSYTVFSFARMEQGEYFQSLLEKENIPFEYHFDDEGPVNKMLFGVHKQYFKKALNCNFLSYAKYRERFIPRWIGIIILMATLALISLAVYNFLIS